MLGGTLLSFIDVDCRDKIEMRWVLKPTNHTASFLLHKVDNVMLDVMAGP